MDSNKTYRRASRASVIVVLASALMLWIAAALVPDSHASTAECVTVTSQPDDAAVPAASLVVFNNGEVIVEQAPTF
jgi:hypothetical protein